MPLGFYLANVCFTQKVKTFLFMFLPPLFLLHLTSYSNAVLALLKQESVLSIALVQRRWGLIHGAQNQDAGAQGFALALPQPAGHLWASCVSALCGVLFSQGVGTLTPLQHTAAAAPLAPGWAATLLKLLVGCVVVRDAGVATPLARDAARSSVLGVLEHCRYAVAPPPHWAFSSFRKRIYSPCGELQLRGAQLGPRG